MNQRKRENALHAIGVVAIIITLVVLMWVAAGCANDEERNNPLDPNAVNYVIPTVTPTP